MSFLHRALLADSFKQFLARIEPAVLEGVDALAHIAAPKAAPLVEGGLSLVDQLIRNNNPAYFAADQAAQAVAAPASSSSAPAAPQA